MATAYLTAMSDAFQERLVPGITDLSIKLDPIWENVVSSKMRVSQDPISKLYQVVYTYAGSLAGGVQFGGTNETNMLLDGADRANIIDNLPTYPGVRDSSLPGVGNYTVSLTRMKGNIYMPFAALQSNQLAASLDDYPALVMRNHIKHVAHIMSCAWYADQSGGLAKINTNNTAGNVTHTAGAHTVTLTTDSGDVIDDGRIRRLRPGLYVDIFNAAYDTCYNTAGFVVLLSAVNYQNGTSSLKFYFESTADADTWGGVGAAGSTNPDNCWLTPRSAVSKSAPAANLSVLPAGYQHFVLNSGTLYGAHGNLSLTDAPELMSVVADSVGDVTETVLNTYLAFFHDALDAEVDTLFTTSGVLVNLLDYPFANNLGVYQRQGATLDVKMGWKGLSYTYDGREYQLYQSPYMTSGHLLGIKTGGGNIQRHIPPKLPGTSSRAGFDSAIEWVGPLFHDSIWMPALANGLVSEGVQAPYHSIMQVTARDPQSLLLKGVTETTP